MNLFRVRHPTYDAQYFLVESDSAEAWSDATHYLPLQVRGPAGRTPCVGGPQHAYAAGLARSLPGSFKLPREQLTIEKISTEDLDALGHAHTDRTLLHMGTVRTRDGARDGSWVSAETPGRVEICVLDREEDKVVFHIAPTADEAMGVCLGTLWAGGGDPMASKEYHVTELGSLRSLAHQMGSRWRGEEPAPPRLVFAEVTARAVSHGATEPVTRAAIWISAVQGTRFSAVLTQGTRVVRREGEGEGDIGQHTAALCAMVDDIFPWGVRHGNPDFKEIEAHAALARLLKITPSAPGETGAPVAPGDLTNTDMARTLRERLLDAFTSYQEEQSQVHRTLRVLLGYDTPEEHDGRTLYGGRTQFALTGAARELRIAYLRGRYDLLGPLTGNLLAYAAAPAAVYPIEGEDP